MAKTLLFDTGGFSHYTEFMQHRLSSKDKDAMTAICAVCGPVEMRMNYRGYVMCKTKWREDQKKANKKRGPRVGQYDYATRMRYLKAPDGEYRMNHLERLLISQDFKCAICRIELDQSANLDHDHETNQVRGLLCRSCNLGLGHFRDNVESLESAIKYLLHNRKQHTITS